MNNYTFSHEGKTYRRIRKDKAKNLFLSGEKIYMVPCNFRLFSPWHFPYCLNRAAQEEFVIDEQGMENRFSALVDSF